MRLGGVDLEEQNGRCGSAVIKLVALVGVTLGIMGGGAAGVWGWDKAKSWRREVRRGKSVGSTGDGNRGSRESYAR